MKYKYQTATSNIVFCKSLHQKTETILLDAERILWKYLKGGRMGWHFRQQHILIDYIPDFVCLSRKLVIEIDGGYHLVGEQPQRDAERTDELMKQGFRVLRFTNDEVIGDIDNVLDIIAKELEDE